jgi:hypothetical protein
MPYRYPDWLIVFMEKAELFWVEDRISEETFRENRLLYMELSKFGIRIIFPGLENATREFASGIPVKIKTMIGTKNVNLDII